MKRKEFLKWSTTGLLSAAFPVESAGKEMGWRRSSNETGPVGHSGRKEFISQKAMVCASQPLAVAAGYDVLKEGGNAIDAAIAVNAMLCLTEPMMCGIGGDLFAMVWMEKEKKLYGLNASGRSPYNWSVSEAQKLGLMSLPSFGPLSWSVPGCVSGWDALLSRLGSKDLRDLLQPVIRYAREGFPLSATIADGWKPENGVVEFGTLNGTFLFNGKGPRKGEIFKNPGLALSFEILATQGAKAFYEGEIADRIVQFSKKHGGHFEKRDFLDHRANWVRPLSTNYRGYDVWQLPPNGQGLVVLQMLNVLEQFDISRLPPNSAEFFHLFLEAKKLCFQDRALYYADNDFVTTPIRELISKEYASQRAKLIHTQKATQVLEPGRIRNASNTVYLTTADEEGNMVSLIQSLYSPWGSHCVVPELGFALQNRGASFSLQEEAWNRLEPHKRPFHTIIPAFVTSRDHPVFSFGVTGGDFQPQGQVQILMNIIDHKMSVQDAGNQLRLWHREAFEATGEKSAGPGRIVAEPGFPVKVMGQLRDWGHRFNDQARYFGGYQGIWRSESPRLYVGASDPRKDGCAFGF